MIQITDEQVEFILKDFESHGIVTEDLRDNLLDHMCCIIESEMNESDNFYRFYESVLPRFCKDNLVELQVETNNLLQFKNFYSMKKILKISGILTVSFTLLGAILKTFHLPGAGIMIILGGFNLSFLFLPLLIALKFKDEGPKIDKWVLSFGFFTAMSIATGLIFKLMHWPGANILMIGGTVLLTFIYVPIYFITRVKHPEHRFNAAVNSVLMMACGGIFFALFNLSASKSYSDQMEANHKVMHNNSELLFASNERLYKESTPNEILKSIHEATIKTNKKLEVVAAHITKHNHTGNILKIKNDFLNEVKAYNKLINELKSEEIQVIELSGIDRIPEFNAELSMIILSRVQQQLAVNENCLLTTTSTLALN